MKKLSETYKELGIAFTFPIEIEDDNGNETYFENMGGFWYRCEYDKDGNQTYYEHSDGYWARYEYDENGNKTYRENSDGFGVAVNTTRTETKPTTRTAMELSGEPNVAPAQVRLLKLTVRSIN
jgi:hypothetical protein